MTVTFRPLVLVTAVSLFCNVCSQIFPPTPWPITAYVQLTIVQAAKLDAVQQAFYSDFYLTVIWRDDSQAGVTTFDVTTSFWPQPEFTNQVLKDAQTVGWTYIFGWYGVPLNLIPPEGANGTWISAYSRISGTFLTKIYMQDFPQDRQNVTLKIESSLFDETIVQFKLLPGSEPFLVPSQLEIIGWQIDNFGGTSISNYYPSFGQTYSQCRVYVEVSRLASYYINRLVSNVALLTTMAFGASTLPPSVAVRNVMVVSCFAGVISWMFIVIQLTPQAGYLTRADVFMNLSFAVIFSMSVAHAINNILSDQAQAETKRVKRESMAKLHKALERMAVRGDHAAQAILSARTAAQAKYAAPGSRATPKGAGFLTPSRSRIPRGSNAGAATGWDMPPRRKSVDASSTPSHAALVANADMTLVAVHTTARTPSGTAVGYTRAPSSDPLAHAPLPPTHPFSASKLLSSQGGDETPGSSQPGAPAQPANDGSTMAKHGSVTKLLIPTTDANELEPSPPQLQQQGADGVAVVNLAPTMQALPPAIDDTRVEEEDMIVSESKPMCDRMCAPAVQLWTKIAAAWGTTTTSRRIDILITATCATAYVIGISIVFLRPPSRPVFDAH